MGNVIPEFADKKWLTKIVDIHFVKLYHFLVAHHVFEENCGNDVVAPGSKPGYE